MKPSLLLLTIFILFSCNNKSNSPSVNPKKDTIRTVVMFINTSGKPDLKEVFKVIADTIKPKYTDPAYGKELIAVRDSNYYFISGIDSATAKTQKLPITDSAGKTILYNFVLPKELILADANWNVDTLIKKIPKK